MFIIFFILCIYLTVGKQYKYFCKRKRQHKSWLRNDLNVVFDSLSTYEVNVNEINAANVTRIKTTLRCLNGCVTRKLYTKECIDIYNCFWFCYEDPYHKPKYLKPRISFDREGYRPPFDWSYIGAHLNCLREAVLNNGYNSGNIDSKLTVRQFARKAYLYIKLCVCEIQHFD